jgi:hypothetical protein
MWKITDLRKRRESPEIMKVQMIVKVTGTKGVDLLKKEVTRVGNTKNVESQETDHIRLIGGIKKGIKDLRVDQKTVIEDVDIVETDKIMIHPVMSRDTKEIVKTF